MDPIYQNNNESYYPDAQDGAPASDPVYSAPANRDYEYQYTGQELPMQDGVYGREQAGSQQQEPARPTPRYYYAEAETTRPKREKKAKKPSSGITMPKLVAMALICAILGGILGAGGVTLLSRGHTRQTEAVTEQSAAAANTESGRVQLGGSDEEAPEPPEEAEENAVTPAAAPAEAPIRTSSVTGGVMDPSAIYDMACTQVVGITTEITYTNYFGFTSAAAVTGSGFIVSSDGYIITNHHVIENAYKGGYDVEVMLNNGDTYTAEIVGFEEDNDIAVLKIDADGLNAVTIGDSDAIKVGETARAVGNPLGELANTMPTGTVSALDSEITTGSNDLSGATTTINVFQIDAAVNSGNSGGPVYNDRGEVIGVVTAKYSSTGVEVSGFVIPINYAVNIANALITNGYVSGKAYFGISVNTVTERVAEYYNMVVGACVIAVDPSSCAAEAGLKVGDIITAIDDTEITSSSDLIAAKKQYKAGDTASLTIYRSGEELTLTIVFDEEKPVQQTAPSQEQQEQQQEENPFGAFGGDEQNPFGFGFGQGLIPNMP